MTKHAIKSNQDWKSIIKLVWLHIIKRSLRLVGHEKHYKFFSSSITTYYRQDHQIIQVPWKTFLTTNYKNCRSHNLNTVRACFTFVYWLVHVTLLYFTHYFICSNQLNILFPHKWYAITVIIVVNLLSSLQRLHWLLCIMHVIKLSHVAWFKEYRVLSYAILTSQNLTLVEFRLSYITAIFIKRR